KDPETGDIFAGPANAPEGYIAAVFLDNAFADPEPKSCAFGGLGGEEGLKQMAGVLGIDAHAGIADADAGAGLAVRGTKMLKDVEAEGAAIRHGLHSVADKVQEDLLQFHREALHGSSATVALLHRNLIELQPAKLQL